MAEDDYPEILEPTGEATGPEEERKPDWESFEPYKGPEEEMITHPVAAKAIHWTMVAIVAGGVFVIAGLWYLFGLGDAIDWVMERPWIAWVVFLSGGVLGVRWLIRMHWAGIWEDHE